MTDFVIRLDGDETFQRSLDDHVQKALIFVQEHEASLFLVERAISDSAAQVFDSHQDPLGVNFNPPERVLPCDLIQTENHLFKKVLTVFAYLSGEVNELADVANSTLFPTLLIFGNPKDAREQETTSSGASEMEIGRVLPFLQELSNFVDRCYSTSVNFIHQLASLYQSNEELYRNTYQYVHLLPAFKSLCELLGILVKIDRIVLQQSHLRQAWGSYKLMMQWVRQDPSKYQTTVEQISKFERMIVSLDQSILSGAILRGCIEQDFEESSTTSGLDDGMEDITRINVRNNSIFLKEYEYCLQYLLDNCISTIGSLAETIEERVDLVGIFASYALYRRLCPANMPPDVKFYRKLWAVQNTVPIVTLCPNVVWFPSDFLLDFAPFDTKKLDPPDPISARLNFTYKFDDVFPQQIDLLAGKACSWMVQMESKFNASIILIKQDVQEILEQRGNLLLKGIALASQIQSYLQTLMSLHLSLELPMQKKVIQPLCMSIEILKAIEFTFFRKRSIIAETIPYIMKLLFANLLKYIRPIKSKFEASKRFDNTKLDILAAVNVVENILQSTDLVTFLRGAIISLSCHILFIQNVLSDVERDQLISLMRRIDLLSKVQPLIQTICSCRFLYWHKELFETFIHEIYEKPIEANRLHYIIAAFSDPLQILKSVLHEDDNTAHLKAYEKYLLKTIDDNIITPLCRDVENDLRLQIHSKNLAHMDSINPKTKNSKSLRSFIEMRPINVFGKIINIKEQVVNYLERTFYNLTTVALHDWMTYAEMRNLAQEKFGLVLDETYLPMGGLDQGLDVLQIMRNIHIFVAKFTYNMNQQNFLEKRPDRGAKNLNTIDIKSIAASLRQHGLGILNTTVNFTYQFLSQKFHVFSQFLFDDYIRSFLSKEIRWFKKHKKEVNNMYPYERATNFVKDIRKLGVSENGRSFLDQFRIIVTEIGNALGYVRMVRSAGMYYCSEAVKFLPDLEGIIHFEAYSGNGTVDQTEDQDDEKEDTSKQSIVGAKLSEETVEAARNLDCVISTLNKNFAEGSDYFKVLVSVFQTVLLSSSHSHLDNFFMIIPPLCISFIEASLQAKDVMYKKNRTKDAYFIDDGFAMGIAYILAILNQGSKFDSLHWFQSIREKNNLDKQELDEATRQREEKIKKKKASQKTRLSIMKKTRTNEQEENDEDGDEEVHTLQLTAKRIDDQKREIEMLFFAVNGARIFFKQNDES